MKIKFLLIALLISFRLFAQEDYARTIVKELASKKYHGRGYVFDGDGKAAKFLVKSFKKLGVGPLTTEYYQDYYFSANTFPKASILSINGESKRLGYDFLIDAACPTVVGSFPLKAFTLPAGDTTMLKNALTGLDGTFLYIDEQESLKNLSADQYKAAVEYLKNNGNQAGTLINSTQQLKWRALTYQHKKPVLYTQNTALPAGTANTIAVNVTAKLVNPHKTQNVCAFIKGTGSSDSTVVITAHYDHIGGIGKDVFFPGANDNASGTAMLLALCKYYSEHPPVYDMVFLAFSGEEIGLLGSTYFAANPLIDLKKIKFLLNLDMAGTGDDGIQVVNGTIFKDQFERMVALNKREGYLPQVLVRGPMNRSDHFPFYEKVVPCFFIYTLGGIDAYHDVYDKYETLPFTNFTNYHNLLRDFINEL